jgi:hypothetical protein
MKFAISYYAVTTRVRKKMNPESSLSQCIQGSMKKTVHVAARLKGFDAPTVWQEFTPLAIQNKVLTWYLPTLLF